MNASEVHGIGKYGAYRGGRDGRCYGEALFNSDCLPACQASTDALKCRGGPGWRYEVDIYSAVATRESEPGRACYASGMPPIMPTRHRW